jgi:aspartate kinase
MEKVVGEVSGTGFTVDEDIAKISLVGAGMKSHPGVAAKMFETLAEAGINIEMIATSSIRVSCVIRGRDVEEAVRVLHAAFDLGSEGGTRSEHPG